jgi:tRNA pseudouridine13 synthase
LSKFNFSSLARVNEAALECSAEIRAKSEYFQVDEILPFIPDGSGGHVWLKIQKKGINTDWLATELARFAGVKPVAVGYAGLKDRHAITTQWFSINLEGFEEPNWSEFENDDIQILEQTRHSKKLKRGVLAGNQFTLRLTNIKGETASWQQNLSAIQENGVPNYFGEQRFGYQMANLDRVDSWFSSGKPPRKRTQRSLYLSAARSWLFNLVLSERIKQGSWNQALNGDVMLLAGTKNSVFVVEKGDDALSLRLANMDIHPTGVMWGRGQPSNKNDSLELEHDVLSNWILWKEGLEKVGLTQDRRALRLFPSDFCWQFLDNRQLELSFFLASGCYATAIFRELAIYVNQQQRN